MSYIHWYYKGPFTVLKMIQTCFSINEMYTPPSSQFILPLAKQFSPKCTINQKVMFS